jgi:hypothetical protein
MVTVLAATETILDLFLMKAVAAILQIKKAKRYYKNAKSGAA